MNYPHCICLYVIYYLKGKIKPVGTLWVSHAVNIVVFPFGVSVHTFNTMPAAPWLPRKLTLAATAVRVTFEKPHRRAHSTGDSYYCYTPLPAVLSLLIPRRA